eukprot:9598426-Heterocapsa_arctica.AAC.1
MGNYAHGPRAAAIAAVGCCRVDVMGNCAHDVTEMRSGPLDLIPELAPRRSDLIEELLQHVAH